MTVSIANPESKIANPKSDRLFTFASGGWVLLVTGLMTVAIFAWALAPVFLHMTNRPPGDGQNIESFQFDLSNLTVPRDLIVPAMLHRDMVPAMDSPSHSGSDAAAAPDKRWEKMQRRNDPQYAKYLVSGDIVIGVSVNGESRAYPLHVMYVHEIVNDTLGGSPVAVTYNWPCASAVVFDRRIDGDAQGGTAAVFAVSGLVYNSNLLMYRRWPPAATNAHGFLAGDLPQGEYLCSQLLARGVSGMGARKNLSLNVIPCELVTWADWSARHPDTTVLDRDVDMIERYKDAAPTQYFQSDKVVFPVRPLADAPPLGRLDLKERVLAVISDGGRRVYPISYVLHLGKPTGTGDGNEVEWTDTWPGARAGGDSRTLRFIGDRKAQTLRVECDPPDPALRAINCFWFAWHAMYPDDQLVQAK